MLLILHHCHPVNPKALQRVVCMLEQLWLTLEMELWAFVVICLVGTEQAHCKCVTRKLSCVVWGSAMISFPASSTCDRLFPLLSKLSGSHCHIIHCHLSNLGLQL